MAALCLGLPALLEALPSTLLVSEGGVDGPSVAIQISRVPDQRRPVPPGTLLMVAVLVQLAKFAQTHG